MSPKKKRHAKNGKTSLYKKTKHVQIQKAVTPPKTLMRQLTECQHTTEGHLHLAESSKSPNAVARQSHTQERTSEPEPHRKASKVQRCKIARHGCVGRVVGIEAAASMLIHCLVITTDIHIASSAAAPLGWPSANTANIIRDPWHRRRINRAVVEGL
jgi:hypothetical protein